MFQHLESSPSAKSNLFAWITSMYQLITNGELGDGSTIEIAR